MRIFILLIALSLCVSTGIVVSPAAAVAGPCDPNVARC
jgi:hypothetical protein